VEPLTPVHPRISQPALKERTATVTTNAISHEIDDRGVALAAPLRYGILLGAVQCLRIAQETRPEAAALSNRLLPYADAAGLADPQEARVPCDVLRAATLSLREWRTATSTPLWDDMDDRELTTAWHGLTTSAA
jgi:hypothetical protein